MKLKITKDFAFAHRGCDVVQYQAGTEVETDDQELIDVALGEKWASKARQARDNKDNGPAPENKAADLPEQPDQLVVDQSEPLDQGGLDLPLSAA
ncbi:MAG: hypothetical protein RLZZ555_262 [Pseudomonadota bacterium]|jgi:hypothetical protein